MYICQVIAILNDFWKWTFSVELPICSLHYCGLEPVTFKLQVMSSNHSTTGLGLKPDDTYIYLDTLL